MEPRWREAAHAGWKRYSGQSEFWELHASRLETACKESFGAPQGEVSEDLTDAAILSTAAILHNIGICTDPLESAPLGISEVHKSAEIARSMLSSSPPWSDSPSAVERVASAIENLSSSSSIFPTLQIEGRSASIGEIVKGVRESDEDVISWQLRESDALEHLERYCLEWSVEQGGRQQIQIAPLDTLSGFIPVWNDCRAGNIRLLGKCAMRDVRSSIGQQRLRKLLGESESFLKELVSEAECRYEPELCGYDAILKARSSALVKGSAGEILQLVKGDNWSVLAEMIRGVTLEKDSTVQAYPKATIVLVRSEINSLRPTAYYVLHRNLQRIRKTHLLWLALYGISPLDLGGRITWRYNDGDDWTISPPFVEVVASGPQSESVQAILDGLHRIAFAREEGFQYITNVRISEASVPFPIEPLAWSSVQTKKSVPAHADKRKYLFHNLDDIRAAGVRFSREFEEKLAPHLLYRGLQPFGSTGVRPTGSPDTSND